MEPTQNSGAICHNMTYLSGVAVDHYRNMEGEDFVYFL